MPKVEVGYKGEKEIVKQKGLIKSKKVFRVGNAVRGFVWAGATAATILGIATYWSFFSRVSERANSPEARQGRYIWQYTRLRDRDIQAFSSHVAAQKMLGLLPEDFDYEGEKEIWVNDPVRTEARQNSANRWATEVGTNGAGFGGALALTMTAVTGVVVAVGGHVAVDGIEEKINKSREDYNKAQIQKAMDIIEARIARRKAEEKFQQEKPKTFPSIVKDEDDHVFRK